MRAAKATMSRALLVAAVVFPRSGAGQDKKGVDPRAATIQVYSQETVLDVVVADDNGEPVRGLTREDFIVKQDGKRQVINTFQEFGEGVRTVTQVPQKLPPNVYSNADAVPTTGPVNIIVMDIVNTRSDDMIYARRGLVRFLKTMPAGTEVAIFAISANKGARLLQGFTFDGAAAAAKVESADVEWIQTSSVDPTEMDEVESNQIAAYVAGFSGRKNIIWISGNTPMVSSQLVEQHAAIYPVDANALKTNVQRFDGELVKAGTEVMIDALHLVQLADSTGGIAYFNSNDLTSPIGRAIKHGASYYTLTYVPPKIAGDQRWHSIDVAVDRPHVHLFHRTGFFAFDSLQGRVGAGATAVPTDGPKLLQASMGGGAPISTQILFEALVEPSTEPANPTDSAVMGVLDASVKHAPLTRYGIRYSVPPDEIKFVEENGTRHGLVEFDLGDFDADGKMVNMLSQTVTMPLSPDGYKRFMTKPFEFFQQIDLPPGMLTLRIGVFDKKSQRVGTMEVPVEIARRR